MEKTDYLLFRDVQRLLIKLWEGVLYKETIVKVVRIHGLGDVRSSPEKSKRKSYSQFFKNLIRLLTD